MTPEQAREAANILNQWADNPELPVQRRARGTEGWYDLEKPAHPKWNFGYAEYRIKPGPRTVYCVYVEENPYYLVENYHVAKIHAQNLAGKTKIVKFVEQEE
jgi:hypothetical protein